MAFQLQLFLVVHIVPSVTTRLATSSLQILLSLTLKEQNLHSEFTNHKPLHKSQSSHFLVLSLIKLVEATISALQKVTLQVMANFCSVALREKLASLKSL